MHRIQLKGPWEYRPVSDSEASCDAPGPMSAMPDGSREPCGLPPPGTVKFPASWNEFLGEFRGTVEFRRPFNRPTNLSRDDRIDLVLAGVGGMAEVRVNGVHVGSVLAGETQGRFDITGHLRPHNEIRIQVRCLRETPAPCGLWGTVSLEIIETSKIGGNLTDF
jgi:beta-galactosidase/beta-glucuronidase